MKRNYSCPRCGGDGWALWDEQGHPLPRNSRHFPRHADHCPEPGCVAERAARKAAQAQATGEEVMPTRPAHKGVGFDVPTWAACDNAALVNAHERWGPDLLQALLDGQNQSRVIVGPVGTGKSRWLAALANTLRTAGKVALLADEADLLARLRPSASGNPDADELIGMAIRADLFVLDDAGKSKLTAWAAETLWRIFNTRYNDLLPSVIASNLSARELSSDSTWEAIISRLIERGRGGLIVLDGRNLRQSRPAA